MHSVIYVLAPIGKHEAKDTNTECYIGDEKTGGEGLEIEKTKVPATMSSEEDISYPIKNLAPNPDHSSPKKHTEKQRTLLDRITLVAESLELLEKEAKRVFYMYIHGCVCIYVKFG